MYAPAKGEPTVDHKVNEYDDDLNERDDFQMSYKPGNTKNMGQTGISDFNYSNTMKSTKNYDKSLLPKNLGGAAQNQDFRWPENDGGRTSK